jgi:hypothetical protein
MKKPKNPKDEPKRKVEAPRHCARRAEAINIAEVIRGFDRAEPTLSTKEIQLMTEEERKIYIHPSTN